MWKFQSLARRTTSRWVYVPSVCVCVCVSLSVQVWKTSMCWCMSVWVGNTTNGLLPTCTAYLLLTHISLYSRSHIWREKKFASLSGQLVWIHFYFYFYAHTFEELMNSFFVAGRSEKQTKISISSITISFNKLFHYIIICVKIECNRKWPIRRH